MRQIVLVQTSVRMIFNLYNELDIVNKVDIWLHKVQERVYIYVSYQYNVAVWGIGVCCPISNHIGGECDM